MLRATNRRPGFTLIELLVVIALIVLLASLTVGAVFRVLGARRETNTNTHLLKIDMSLTQMWKSKLESIKKESPPQAVIDFTKNADGSIDMDRARAFHLKMRLRQEFPQNFGELFSWGTVGTYSYLPKSSYTAAVKNPQRVPPVTGPFIESDAEAFSAAMLLLILSQGTGGTTIDAESIAPTTLLSYPQASGPPVQLRVFIDAFGKHIAFRRLADQDMTDVLSDLNQNPFVSQSQIASGNMDPQDPAGRLKIATWPNRAVLMPYLAYPTPGQRPYLPDPFDGLNRGPFAFSAGKDEQFFTPDDLYSYRIQQSGKGN